jgi:hypothetical protein
MKRILFTALAGSLILTGCSEGSNSEKSGAGETELKSESVVRYQVDPKAVSVKWTAFKFTDRAGVGGQMDSIMVSFGEPAATAVEVLRGVKVMLPAAGINSQNPDRDKKIIDNVFGGFDLPAIVARVANVNGNEVSGEAEVLVQMNNAEKAVMFTYSISGSEITLNGNLDFTDWNALSGVEALNKVCYDLHKGADGVSKLWPDVDVEVKAVLTTVAD